MSSFEEFGRVYAELLKWKIAETELSNAYLRLRQLIPGAFDTPHAPTGNQVWAVTESALRRAVSNHDAMVEALRPFAWYFEVNDCNDIHGSDALEVPVKDLRAAAKMFEALGLPIKPIPDAVSSQKEPS